MRRKIHAEIGKWTPFDPGCQPRNYTSVEACDVIRRFTEFHFVGDSFVRKVARTFILILRSDPVYGALIESYNVQKSQFCIGLDQLYWKECNLPGTSLNESLRDKEPLCGVPLDHFFIDYYGKGNIEESKQFLELIKSLAGKVGSVVFLAVGAHTRCDFNFTKTVFIEPAIHYLEEYYIRKETNGAKKQLMRWPIITFMFPDSPGLLKPPRFHALNGKERCNKYSDQMKAYLDGHHIHVMDFRELTSNVHSYDGTHYGFGVNLVKVQLLLNHLDSISTNSY